MIAKGDYVSGEDAYGNGVAGEVIATGAGYVHIQPTGDKARMGNGSIWPL